MVEPATILISGGLIFLVLQFILLQKLVEIVTLVFLNKYTAVLLGGALLLFFLIPDLVTPYYSLLWEYFVNGIVSVWNLIVGLFTQV